jgi:hypothetical protein
MAAERRWGNLEEVLRMPGEESIGGVATALMDHFLK